MWGLASVYAIAAMLGVAILARGTGPATRSSSSESEWSSSAPHVVSLADFSECASELQAARSISASLTPTASSTPSLPLVDASALLAAITLGDAGAVASALRRGGETAVSATSPSGEPPLVTAARRGDAGIVRALIDAGAPVDGSDRNGSTALYAAARAGALATVQLLLARGARVDATRNDGFAPLHTAAFRGHADVVRALLGAGARADDAVAVADATPLYMAALGGHADVVTALVAHGARVNWARVHGRATPLIAAAFAGHAAAAAALLAAGADVNHTTADGFAAVHVAAQHRRVDLVALLAAHGAAVNVPATVRAGATPLMVGAGDAATTAALLRAGADPNAASRDGAWRPLVIAASLGSTDAVAALLAAGARPNEGRAYPSALSAAADGGHAAIVRLLLAAGAERELDWSGRGAYGGRAPIIAASAHGHAEVVVALLEGVSPPKLRRFFDADPSDDGFTLLAGGIASRRPAVVAALLNAGALRARLPDAAPPRAVAATYAVDDGPPDCIAALIAASAAADAAARVPTIDAPPDHLFGREPALHALVRWGTDRYGGVSVGFAYCRYLVNGRPPFSARCLAGQL